MKKMFGFLLPMFVFFSPLVITGETILLNDLTNPSGFASDGNHLYIIEFPRIYMYSLTDYRLLKEFGKQGEGPGEFLRYARIHFQPDYLIIQSQNRVSYFSRDGKYIQEKKTPIAFDRGAKPLGNRWVVSHTVPGNNDPRQTDLTVNIYDSNFKKVKEIYRQKYYFQIGKPVNGIYLAEDGRRLGIRFWVYDNRIYIEGEDGETGNIYVYDNNGQKIDTLHQEFEKVKVTDTHKKAVEDFYNMKRRRLFAIVTERGWLYWPDFFPAVRWLSVEDNQIAIIPYKKKQGKNQLFIFDLKMKLLKQVSLPGLEETMFSFYPFTIKNGKLYRLVENQDEAWELHVTKLD